MNIGRIVGVDPGNEICGITVLDNGAITEAKNLTHEKFWTKLSELLIHPSVKVIVEDIKPYSVRLTPEVIDTCKFIGQLVYRLRMLLSEDSVLLVSRTEVKKWAFDNYREQASGMVDEKILKASKKGKYMSKDGSLRSSSFHFVDDRIVKEIMISHFAIPRPAPGKPYQFGLKDHAWQALACAVVLQERLKTSGNSQSVLES